MGSPASWSAVCACWYTSVSRWRFASRRTGVTQMGRRPPSRERAAMPPQRQGVLRVPDGSLYRAGSDVRFRGMMYRHGSRNALLTHSVFYLSCSEKEICTQGLEVRVVVGVVSIERGCSGTPRLMPKLYHASEVVRLHPRRTGGGTMCHHDSRR